MNNQSNLVSNIIANSIVQNLGCTEPANSLTQAQIVNISCTPPANWGNVVYNGETCKMARSMYPPNDPRICTFCNACCATDLDQSNFVKITSSCGITEDLLSKIKTSIITQLNTMKYNQNMPESLYKLLNTLTVAGITKAITNIQSIQNISIKGVGTQARVSQSIVMSVVLNTIRTPEFITALNNYINDVNNSRGSTSEDVSAGGSSSGTSSRPELSKTLNNLRNGTIPPQNSISGISNLYTNALLSALQSTSSCFQNVQVTQSSQIDCSSPEIIAKSLINANSPECKYALINRLPNPEIYCSACSISDSSQNIILNFNANCTIESSATAASDAIQTWLNTPGNVISPDARPVVKQDITNPSYYAIVNKLKVDLDNAFATQVLQSIITGQNINANVNNQHIKGISQNDIYNNVLNAVVNNKVLLDGINNLDTYFKVEPITDNNNSNSNNNTNNNKSTNTTYILYIFIIFIVIIYIQKIIRNRNIGKLI
jgi:hypothetical protein